MSTQQKAILVLVLIGVVCAVAVGFEAGHNPTGKVTWTGSISDMIADRTLISTQDLQPAAKPLKFLTDRTFLLPASIPCVVTVTSVSSGLIRTMELSVDGNNAAEVLWEPNADPSVPISDPPKPKPVLLSTASKQQNPIRIAVMKAGGKLTLTGQSGAARTVVSTVHLR